MFIRCNYHLLARWTYVYAWSADNSQVGFKFWHDSSSSKLQPKAIIPACTDDRYVVFESKMALNDWVKIIKGSEFNDPKNYKFLSHNCTHGTVFALEAAGIELKNIKSSPVRLFDPYNVFKCIKQYKLQAVSHLTANYTFAEFRLKIWCDSHPTHANKNLVEEITKGLDDRQKSHPEHVEAHLDVLTQTYKMISSFTSEADRQNYEKSSEQFRERRMTQSTKNAIFLNLVSCLSFGALGYGAYCYLSNAIPMLCHRSLAYILPSIGIFKSPKKVPDQPGSEVVESKLSENMKKLSGSYRSN